MAKEGLKRVNLNLPIGIINRIDAYAAEIGITRTAAISVLIANQLQQIESIKAIDKGVNFVRGNEK